MSLAPRLDLRQTQSLVMTPQLQQAIKLLALSNLEFEAFIGEALETNPLLEAGEISRERERVDAPIAEEPRPEPTADELIARGAGEADAPLDIVDRAYIIYDGRVLFAGSPEELVADANVRRLYLGEGFSL